MRAATEGENCGNVVARDVEAIRIVIDRWIPVGGEGVDDDERSRREQEATEFDIVSGGSRHDAGCGRVAHAFFYGLHRKLRLVAQLRPLVRMLAQNLH